MTEKHRKGNKKSPLGTTQKQKNVFGSLIGYTNIDFLIQLKCILILQMFYKVQRFLIFRRSPDI